MLACRGRGNRVLWGRHGLCCGKAEKAIPTPQGESRMLALTKGRVEVESQDDQDSGFL